MTPVRATRAAASAEDGFMLLRLACPFVCLALASLALGAAKPATSPAAPVTKNNVGLYGTVYDSEAETIAAIEKCKANGVGALLPSLSGGGTVVWKTDKEHYYTSLKEKLASGYDGLEVLIKHAHAAGIKVIPSIAIGPAVKFLEQHPEWETLDRHGRPSNETTTRTFSFAYPEARRAKIAVMMDLVNGYDVDGILLDYCRYPENSKSQETKRGFYGYDAPLIETCQRLYGFDPRKVEIGSADYAAFNGLRSDTVTAFVKEFRDTAKGAKPKLIIAGFGDTDPDMERDMCGRDWASWGTRGLIDDFYLATYTEKPEQMAAIVKRARAALGGDKVKLHAALAPFNNFVTTNDAMRAITVQQLAGGADSVWVYREDFLEKLNLWAGVRAANELVRKRVSQ
jgi:uncharacterized lipoprotein YddW (UPF0748 family)